VRREGRDPEVNDTVSPAQIAAMDKWGVQQAGSYDYLKTITQPTLVVNGSNDVIMPTINTFIMQQNIPNAQLIIYPIPITARSTSIPSCSSGTSRCSCPSKARRDRSYARSRASFWVATAVVAHTLWTSAAPAMTYRLYAAEWNLTHTATTAIFAVFPIVVVAVLILSGDISDYIGRRATILIGLTSSLLGTALFAAAPSVLWVFVGRAFTGLGVGLCAGPATAAMVEFSAAGQETRAGSITTVAQAIGSL